LPNIYRMDKNRKVISYIAAGVIILFVAAIGIKWMLDSAYRKNIPALPDMKTFAVPLKEQISGASQRAKRNPSADNLGKLGMVYHSSAYYDKAAQCYKLAVKRNESKWIWNYYLGYLNMEMGESEPAIKNFRAVIKENRKAYHAWYYIGEGYHNLNEDDKALVSFKNITNLKGDIPSSKRIIRNDYFPLSTYARFQLAQVYINTKKIEQAESTLQEIVKSYSTFGPAYRLLGSVYNLEGDISLSKEFTLRAGDLMDLKTPVDTLVDRLALLSRSDLYILKQIDEAERAVYNDWALVLAGNAMKYIPDNKYLISKAIMLLLKMSSGKIALLYLNQHLNSFKDDFNELKQVGNQLYDKAYYSQSINYYLRALELKPEDSEVLASLVLAYLNSGNKQQALDELNEQLGKYRNNPKILGNAVYIMLTMNEKEKAKSFLSQLKKLSPSSPKTYQLNGIIAQQDGNLREAMVMYESALKGDPGDLVSIQSLGEILARQKMWNRLISLLRKALEFHPNDPYLLEKLGTLLVTCPDMKLRNYPEGRIYSERAFIHKGSTSEISLSAGKSLAEAYAALGDMGNASIYMNHILEMARSQNAPREFLEDIEKKLAQYSSNKP
jgi:tetratricopeptide (TPR) repeat protein